MPDPDPVFRAPMRSRTLELAPGIGAEHAIGRGVCAIGGVVSPTPDDLHDALAAVADQHGERAARRLRRFADVPVGAFVWTRDRDGGYRLGRLRGPWHYDATEASAAVDLPHVRPTAWLDRRFAEDEVPAAVAATFGRGGRNFQRTHDAEAERDSAALWAAGDG
ncbi:hypothetical protein [Patulibacter defluvii]|uniref:hypothetical protein n=1 Tax=Patulibacter defluvii TaxID=3095358 RepID=UPI002A755A0F|nr:hypothetical protein [Patulibacter sp. DM4]